MKILIPVDGSANASRAIERLVASLRWYAARPSIELLAVHLPVPNVYAFSHVISRSMVESYYAEECDDMLRPARALLDASGVAYVVHTAIGDIGECIVAKADALECDLIWMGTRGMNAAANLLLGSVATRVLHLARVPVTLVPVGPTANAQ